MSTTTTNLGLVKPERSDNYSVDVMSGNMDIIDTRIAALENKSSIVEGKVTSRNFTYNGYGTLTLYALRYGSMNHWNATPFLSSTTPFSGKFSFKKSNTANDVQLVQITKAGTIITDITTEQTEYTVTDAYTLYLRMQCVSSTNTVTVDVTYGIPVEV